MLDDPPARGDPRRLPPLTSVAIAITQAGSAYGTIGGGLATAAWLRGATSARRRSCWTHCHRRETSHRRDEIAHRPHAPGVRPPSRGHQQLELPQRARRQQHGGLPVDRAGRGAAGAAPAGDRPRGARKPAGRKHASLPRRPLAERRHRGWALGAAIAILVGSIADARASKTAQQ